MAEINLKNPISKERAIPKNPDPRSTAIPESNKEIFANVPPSAKNEPNIPTINQSQYKDIKVALTPETKIQEEISRTEKIIETTTKEIAECGLLDSILGTKNALSARLSHEENRRDLLQKLVPAQSQHIKQVLKEIEIQLKPNEALISEKMNGAVQHTNIAFKGAFIINTAGTVIVESSATALAGPVVGASIGLGIRTATNIGQTIVEKSIGEESNFTKRFTDDSLGAIFSAFGGKIAQSAVSKFSKLGGKFASSFIVSGIGGFATTIVNKVQDTILRIANDEKIFQNGDLKKLGINTIANSAAWLLGDRTGRYSAALSETTRKTVALAGSTTIAATADYANNGEVSYQTISNSLSASLGNTAAAHHLASRGHKTAPLTVKRGHIPKNITPPEFSALSLHNEGKGRASIHLDNIYSLAKGKVTPEIIRSEFASLIEFSKKDPNIHTVIVRSPILAKISPDGLSASLRPAASKLMREHNGSEISPSTLTPDFQKLGMILLNLAGSLPKGRIIESVSKIGDHEYTVGFEISVK